MIMKSHWVWLSLLVFIGPTATQAAKPPPAGVGRFEILERTPAFGGRSFGDHGSYEEIKAVAHLRIDPAAPGNRGIVDLDKAPRGSDGLVAYDVDVAILRPKDPRKARRVLVSDILNRGGKIITGLNGTANPTGADPGDGFLMRQGYTLVWVGWQAELGPGRMQARLPVATENGAPIVGFADQEAIFDVPGAVGKMTLPYPAAMLDPARATLTVQARAADAARSLPSTDWRYLDDRHVEFARPADMDAGAIYRLRYPAKDPVVAGLGFAAVRDVVAFLRHDRQDGAGRANPLQDLAKAPCEVDAQRRCLKNGGGYVDIAVGFGVSQSGRFLRDFLWRGFNADTAGRPVFDGLMPNMAGARTTWTNVRFAQPGRFSRQHEDHGVPGFTFPFSYAPVADPVTGMRDGLMERCRVDGTCPKVIHLDTSAEFWQAGAALVGTGGGAGDLAQPADVRLFMVAGGTHAPGAVVKACEHRANPLASTALQKALLVDLVDWAAGRSAPPASRWPRVADGGLSPFEARSSRQPAVINQPEPPGRAASWPVLTPAVDADGHEIAGVRLPEIAAPVGSYLGWNLRAEGYAKGELCNLFGAFIPFAAETAGPADPRLPLAARYRDHEAYVAAVAKAATGLQADRLMLEEDVAAAVGRARTETSWSEK